MGLFGRRDGPCRHHWRQVSKTVFPSAWEQMHPATKDDSLSGLFRSMQVQYKTNLPLDRSFFRKKETLVLACDRCGALDKTETVFEIEPPAEVKTARDVRLITTHYRSAPGVGAACGQKNSQVSDDMRDVDCPRCRAACVCGTPREPAGAGHDRGCPRREVA